MDIDVFISYHTETSKSVVEAVSNKLEGMGIKCWYAPRNVEGSYAGSIVKAIKAASVFLLVLNTEASKSKHVLNEIEMATERLDNNIKAIIPFRIAAGEISDDAEYYLKRIHWIDAINPPMEERINELVSRICGILGVSNAAQTTGETKAANRLQSTAVLNNHKFIGRENELAEMERLLEEETVVFLYGLGGSGKTEIAKKYASLHKNDYSTIIIARCDTSLCDMIISEKYFKIEGFERVFSSDGERESDEEYAKRKLEKIKELSDENTLIIIDNFDADEDDMLSDVLEGTYRLIITTRTNFEYSGLQVIHINSLEAEEQKQLFIQNYNRPLKGNDGEIIDEIISFVGGHTLAIELLAQLMSSKAIKPEKMLDRLKSEGISDALTGNVRHGLGKNDSVYSYIKLLYKTEALSDEEKAVMMNLSLLPVSGMEEDEFIELCELEDGGAISSLANRSWIQYELESGVISLHPLVAEVVRNECKPDFENCRIFIRNIADIFSNTWSINEADRVEYGEIAKCIYNRYPLKKKEELDIYREMLKVFMNLAYYGVCEKLLSEMEAVIGSEDSMELGSYYYNIADMHLWMMDYDSAVEYMLKSIGVFERIAPESYDMAYMLKHLSHTYHAMYLHREESVEYLEKAKECLERSGVIFESCVPENSADMGSQYYAYGLNCYYYGNYEKAIEYEMKSYKIFYDINGEIDSNTTAPMRTLARIYSKTGRFEEAIAMQTRAVEVRRQLWGVKSFKYLDYHESLADIYYENGHGDKAVEALLFILECMEGCEDIPKTYHDKIKAKIETYQD